MINFSIVIPTLNRAARLGSSIRSILKNFGANHEQAEIIIVDNGSTDNTKEIVSALAREFENLRYIFQPRKGYHHAVNTGVVAAANEIVILADDDLVFSDNFFLSLAAAYDNQEIWCAGGKVFVRWINGERPPWLAESESTLGHFDLGPVAKHMQWPEAPVGASYSFRRNRFLELGGFNPDRRTGGDSETGFCRKIYKHGGKILYVPEAISYHLVSASEITQHYMIERYRLQAHCDSYAQFQDNLYKPSELIGKIWRYTKFLSHEVVHKYKHCHKGKTTGHKNEWMIAYFKERIKYDLRLLTSSKFRQFVLKTNWVDEIGKLT